MRPKLACRRALRARGFTLVELMTVVAITGILSAIVIMLVTKHMRAAATIDARSSAYPVASLRDLPAGEYWMQPFVNVYTKFARADGKTVWLHMDQWEGQNWSRSPGNLYSDVQRIHFDPAKPFHARLEASHVIPPVAIPADTRFVKRFKFQSPSLTKFWGRPIYLGATVLLPRDYRTSTISYPVNYIQGHFGLNAPYGFEAAPRASGGRSAASVEPSFTTIVSKSGYSTCRTPSNASCSVREPLYVQITMEMRGGRCAAGKGTSRNARSTASRALPLSMAGAVSGAAGAAAGTSSELAATLMIPAEAGVMATAVGTGPAASRSSTTSGSSSTAETGTARTAGIASTTAGISKEALRIAGAATGAGIAEGIR